MAITVNELRIGNILYWSTNNDIVFVDSEHIRMCSVSQETFNMLYKSIPITEEWLLKFGFVNMENFPLKYVLRFKMDSTTEYVPCIEICNYWLCSVKYIHQLQNLYFSLTGKELEL